MKTIRLYIILVICTLLVPSCKDKETSNVLSSDAEITSMRFTANDSFPGLALASFTIEERLDTGIIYNVDSLLYGTPIDKVIPVFTFKSSPAGAFIFSGEDTINFVTGDTIDFTHQPTLIQVVSADLSTEKWYEIYVNVHQVDPDLYVWEKLTDRVYNTDGAEQKAVYFNDKIYLYVNNGFQVHLYTSLDGAIWSDIGSVTSLPKNCQVENIVAMTDNIVYVEETSCYTSSDGSNWTKDDILTNGDKFVSLLFYMHYADDVQDTLWAVTQSADGKYHAVVYNNADAFENRIDLPDNFPVSDFTALSFKSVSGRPRAMIVGGFSADGKSLNTRWNIEYAAGQYRITDFTIEQPTFGSLTGATIIPYNHKFLMFGGVDANNELGEYPILESDDEGMNWIVPDTLKNRLPISYTARQHQSVFVDSKNYIFLIGGHSRTEVFSDVYRGKLNSVDW